MIAPVSIVAAFMEDAGWKVTHPSHIQIDYISPTGKNGKLESYLIDPIYEIWRWTCSDLELTCHDHEIGKIGIWLTAILFSQEMEAIIPGPPVPFLTGTTWTTKAVNAYMGTQSTAMS